MTLTYTNPVYDQYMADPFVLRQGADYYAYGTGAAAADGRQFPVLHSRDLVHWTAHGGALIPPPEASEFWAPEVAYHAPDNLFYLYYSAKGIAGRDHQLRVATSADPLGPFADAGVILTPDDPFTIDAHPFQDADGDWYLFYARDFLVVEREYRVGTGIVVDRLTDMRTLAGDPRLVIRPYADWQLFMANRPMYGGVYDWHTVEGAAVRRHSVTSDGQARPRYYCFYSGGAWERENYGIYYVVADHPLGPYTRPDEADGALLRSVPGQVIGPGHNSFTESPGGQELVVYHAWDAAMSARLLRIDRLRWTGEHSDQPVMDGPTWTPQTLD